jgi:phage protein U
MTFILMGYGPYRFEIASFAYEKLKRKHEARIEAQKIIGGRPSLHKMGFEVETISFTSTFFPHHLPGNTGLSQLAGLRSAVGTSMPLVGNRVAFGDMFGRWALKSLEDGHEEIFVDGVGQKIEVSMELLFDGKGRTPGAAAAIARLFG